LCFGGNIAPRNTSIALTEEYDGTNWTTGGALSTSRFGLAGGGTQTAAIAMTGRNSPPNTSVTNTELYDGSSWTNTTANATGRGQVGGGGSSTAGIVFLGSAATITNATEEFTGTALGTETVTTS